MQKFTTTLMLVIGLCGCGGSSSNNSVPNPVPSTPDFTQLREVIQEDLTNNNAAAVSIAIYKDGEIVFAEAFGEKVKGQGVPATPNTLFQLGSTTKMFTAVATLQLVEQGLISLDDKLVSAMPEIQYPGEHALDWQNIEIRHLLTHQSGLRDNEVQIDQPLLDVMLSIYPNAFSPMNPPNLFFNYSNPNWSYLGALIEDFTHQDYADYMRQNVFEKLGMPRTTIGRSGAIIDGDYALGYQEQPNGNNSYISDISQIPITIVGHPAGSETWSTPSEQLKMAEFLLNGNENILEDTLRTEITKAHVHQEFAGLPQHYGYGVFVDDGFIHNEQWYPIKVWEHGGNTNSYTSLFFILPEQNVAVSLMSSGAFNDFKSSMVAALNAVSTVPSPMEEPVLASLPEQYSKHEGTYSTGELTIIVTKEESNLVLTIPEFEATNTPYERRLTPVGDATFMAVLNGEAIPITFFPTDESTESVYIRSRQNVAIKDGY
ncbi:serine hydrolase [Glaciecola sp. KUL10]|uniref:serine hydrolase domain-containing protein n=1 Tax=Glaciecola sp. (strain KUL10) TaxID=2161813 RepID=UPI000D782408|nr:serine hydrolase domain-containing protein [Glaciecola sp. KUL10]GBL05909.1 beta-lactamase-like protein [Glaciecola sp. KUL10]